MSGTDQSTHTSLGYIEMTPLAEVSGGVHDTIDNSEHCVVVHHIVSTKQALVPKCMHAN